MTLPSQNLIIITIVINSIL